MQWPFQGHRKMKKGIRACRVSGSLIKRQCQTPDSPEDVEQLPALKSKVLRSCYAPLGLKLKNDGSILGSCA
jgi:hypothetical protein